MKKAQQQKVEWLKQGHGEYTEIPEEKEFFNITKNSTNVVCHFFRDETFRLGGFRFHNFIIFLYSEVYNFDWCWMYFFYLFLLFNALSPIHGSARGNQTKDTEALSILSPKSPRQYPLYENLKLVIWVKLPPPFPIFKVFPIQIVLNNYTGVSQFNNVNYSFQVNYINQYLTLIELVYIYF